MSKLKTDFVRFRLPEVFLIAIFCGGIAPVMGTAQATDTLAHVTGHVVDDLGPVAGVKVKAIAKVFKQNPDREYLFLDSVLTDSAGSFQFDNLDVTPNAVTGTGYYFTSEKPGYRNGGSSNIPLNPGDHQAMQLKIVKILTLDLRVMEKGAANHALAGAQVCVGPFANQFSIAVTDSMGRIHFPDIYAGKASITVAKDGYGSSTQTKVLSELSFPDSLTIQLTPTVPDSSRALSGKLLSNSGRRLIGDTVFFSCTMDSVTSWLYAFSVDSGAYRIRGIPSVCNQGILVAGSGGMQIVLSGAETHADLIIDYQPGSIGILKWRRSNRDERPVSAASGSNFQLQAKGFYFNILGRPVFPNRP